MGSKINLKMLGKFKPTMMFIASFALILGSVSYVIPQLMGQTAYAISPQLNVTGLTADGIEMPTGGENTYTLNTNANSSQTKEYLVQFKSDTFSSEILADQHFELKLKNPADVATKLKEYYLASGVQEPYLGYLMGAADGDNAFAYINGNTNKLVDGARYHFGRIDTDMAIPGNVPLGTYDLVGTIVDLALHETDVAYTLNVINVSSGALADLTAVKAKESQLDFDDYVDYSAVTDALALSETTDSEVNDKTEAINTAISNLVFIGLADLTIAEEDAAYRIKSAIYKDYSAVTSALLLPENTNAEIVAKTTEINNAINGLVFADGATLSINTVVSGDGATKSGKIEKATESTAIYSGIVTKVSIPEDLEITGPSDWDGSFSLPTATTTEITRQGYNTNVTSAITIGSNNKDLTFDKGVRIMFTGQADKFAGWKNHAGIFGGITAICTADNQTAGDALLAGADCKINVGSDLVIWTKHFTTFMTYSQELIASNNVQPTIVVGTATDIQIAQQQEETLGVQTVKDTKATDKAADKVAEVARVSSEWTILGLAWYWWLLAIVAAASARRVYTSFSNSRGDKNTK